MNLPCGKCGQELSSAAFNWYEIAGDGYTHEVCIDPFLGGSDANTQDMSRQEGDALAGLIRRCPDPSERLG